MKKIFLIISSLCLFLLLKGQTPANDPHWELLWEDNFSYFDTNKWVKAEHCDHGGEPQLYKAENVDIWNGKLRIRLLEENINCSSSPPTTWVCGPCYNTTHDYTSGWINSKDSYDMQYGYAEAKIFFEYGNGLWPAFWLWSYEDPRTEEIDIVELFPGMLETGNNIYNGQRHNENVNTSHLHYGIDPNIIRKHYIYPIDNYNNWHTYGIEWSPNKIIIYVDGLVVNNIPNPSISDPKSIIFNLALIDPANYDIVLPYSTGNMYVDYIKIYKLKNDCSTPIWTCNYDFSTYDNKVKSVISIGGSGCSNSLTTGQNITLRAKDYVIINGDFTVPIGAELYIDCSDPCY